MRDRIESILGWVLAFIFLATTVAVVWQVIGRYLLDAPSSATEEIARFMLIWMGMLSTCACTANASKRHLHSNTLA